MLNKRFGMLDETLLEPTPKLPPLQLEALAEAVLDFKESEDLARWLESIAQPIGSPDFGNSFSRQKSLERVAFEPRNTVSAFVGTWPTNRIAINPAIIRAPFLANLIEVLSSSSVVLVVVSTIRKLR